MTSAVLAIWGYFGKRGGRECVEFVDSEERLHHLESASDHMVSEVRVLVENELLRVHTRPLAEEPNKFGSIVIASLVTSYARYQYTKLQPSRSSVFQCEAVVGTPPPLSALCRLL